MFGHIAADIPDENVLQLTRAILVKTAMDLFSEDDQLAIDALFFLASDAAWFYCEALDLEGHPLLMIDRGRYEEYFKGVEKNDGKTNYFKRSICRA